MRRLLRLIHLLALLAVTLSSTVECRTAPDLVGGDGRFFSHARHAGEERIHSNEWGDSGDPEAACAVLAPAVTEPIPVTVQTWYLEPLPYSFVVLDKLDERGDAPRGPPSA